MDENEKKHLVVKKFHQNMKIYMMTKDNNNYSYGWFISIMGLLWGFYEQNVRLYNKCARIRIILMMDFEKEGIELNDSFVRFNVV